MTCRKKSLNDIWDENNKENNNNNNNKIIWIRSDNIREKKNHFLFPPPMLPAKNTKRPN